MDSKKYKDNKSRGIKTHFLVLKDLTLQITLGIKQENKMKDAN